MATPWNARFTRWVDATSMRFVTSTVGMPSRSSSFASADPQREHVPQVAEASTASTCAAFSSSAIARAILRATSGSVPLPAIV